MAKYKTTNVGITINTEWIEITQHAKDLKSIQNYLKIPIPMATMDQAGDRMKDPETLATSIAAMLTELNIKPGIKQAHLSIPGSLLRIVEMPKIPKSELLIALTSEAERYAIFNDTEALVDYEVISEEPGGTQKIMLIAIRKDTYEAYTKAFEMAKIKITSLEADTISSLRGFKYSGAMDALLSEIGDQPWGTMHFEPERIRIGLWQGSQIKNWREVLLDTSDIKLMGVRAPIIQDLIEEIRRTISMTEPAVWVTYGIPDNISAALASKIGTEVRSMHIGHKLDVKEHNPSLAAIGVAFKNQETFPASTNIKSMQAAEVSTELSTPFIIMLGISGVLTVLVIFMAIIFLGWGLFVQNEISNLEKENTQIIQQIDEVKKETFGGGSSEELIERIIKLTATNKIMAQTIEKISHAIPSETWISRISLISTRPEGALADNKPEYLPIKIFFNATPDDDKLKDNPRTPSEFISGNDKDNTFSIYGTTFNAESVTDFLNRLHQKESNNKNLKTLSNLRLVFLEELAQGKTNYNFLIGSRDWLPAVDEALSFNEKGQETLEEPMLEEQPEAMTNTNEPVKNE